MGARRFEDLVAWQLSCELREEIMAFSARDPTCRDRRFCDQIRDSACSAPSNIAEGFGRFYPREFSRFLSIAAGSLQETRNHLLEARIRGYISAEELERLTRLTLRAFRASTRLAAYLRKVKHTETFNISNAAGVSDWKSGKK
jgi:four helix bundle protein